MKKIILPIVLALLTISTASAKETVNNNPTKVVTSVTSLCQLIKEGDYNGVKNLLENGHKVNERSNGLTPLMFAARYNRHKIAKLLIGYGANAKLISKNGEYDALKLARISRAKETYYVIKEAVDRKA